MPKRRRGVQGWFGVVWCGVGGARLLNETARPFVNALDRFPFWTSLFCCVASHCVVVVIFMFRRLFRLLFLLLFLVPRSSLRGLNNCPKCWKSNASAVTHRPATNASVLSCWDAAREGTASASASMAPETSNCSLVTGQYNAPRGNREMRIRTGFEDGQRKRLHNRLLRSYQVATVCVSTRLDSTRKPLCLRLTDTYDGSA